MLSGVSLAKRKNGAIYYRSGITYHNKHISLGSFSTEEAAGAAYLDAGKLLNDAEITLITFADFHLALPFEKLIILLNFRDNKLYIRNPIYLRKGYFSYFLSPSIELKFDIDDLFYYSEHKIQKRNGHLFVSDYGMQYSILARYGIRPYAVAGRDYSFINDDPHDFRYANIRIKNHYHGVLQIQKNGITKYRTVIHINGNYIIGTYATEEKAAIAYNKAADMAKTAGIHKSFPENYVESCSPKEYAEIYTALHISKRYLAYLNTITSV